MTNSEQISTKIDVNYIQVAVYYIKIVTKKYEKQVKLNWCSLCILK